MELQNKTIRRLIVLQNILQPVQFKEVKASKSQKLWLKEDLQVEITLPEPNLQQAFHTVFTQEALNFLSELLTEFNQQIHQLYLNRAKHTLYYTTNTNVPTFLKSVEREDKNWKINSLPARLQCRRVDLGDVSPANEEHFFGALKNDVQGIQVDFDDGHCPTWKNQIVGYYNIYKIIHGLVPEFTNLEDLPVLMLRPRAWNMIEHNIMINGQKVPGSLVDFSILMYHNAQILFDKKSGPFFYLSKLENKNEAKLWNDIFIYTEKRLNIPIGSIKACVLIENILSTFQMDEILFALKEHSLGLNCGIWDYAASIICKFGKHPKFLLPDRNKYVNMDKHFLKKYMELVVRTCHQRGAPATGGMAAQIVTEKKVSETVQKVINAKRKEIIVGCDGFIIYDSKLIPYLKLFWKHQEHVLNAKQTEAEITETDLLLMPTGTITTEGLKHNTEVSILFIYNWCIGNGHFIYKNSVEDSATAEISRSQIWQWIRHKAKLENNETVTQTMVQQLSAEFINKQCANKNENILKISRDIFLDIVTTIDFVDFITSYLNNNCVFRSLQLKYHK